jgi:DNA-directed RNA polymerase specialized sigma24 family protein
MKPYIPAGSDSSEAMLKMLENREIWRKGSESFYTWLVHIYTYIYL